MRLKDKPPRFVNCIASLVMIAYMFVVVARLTQSLEVIEVKSYARVFVVRLCQIYFVMYYLCGLIKPLRLAPLTKEADACKIRLAASFPLC